jgi:hypothetical protein
MPGPMQPRRPALFVLTAGVCAACAVVAFEAHDVGAFAAMVAGSMLSGYVCGRFAI